MMKNKKVAIVLAIGIVVGFVFLAGLQEVLTQTNSTEFCTGCHSMQLPKTEWEGSKHYTNADGIRAECSDCHIPKKGLAYYKTKVMALKDVYHELAGGLPDESTFEEHRLRMAKKVWSDLKASDSATCRSCHHEDAWDLYTQSESARKMHMSAKEENKTCIDCHKEGLAHFPPDRSGEAKEANKVLLEIAKSTSVTTKTVYPINVIELFDDDNRYGRVMPTTQLTVLKSEGGKRQVRIEGFQQEGVESMIYGIKGQRLVLAILNQKGVDKLTTGDYQEDSETGIKWRKVSLRGWIGKEALLDNLKPLWDYGTKLNDSYCAGCHSVIHGDHFTANQWVGIIKGMAERTSISDSELLLLTLYLQNHAKI